MPQEKMLAKKKDPVLHPRAHSAPSEKSEMVKVTPVFGCKTVKAPSWQDHSKTVKVSDPSETLPRPYGIPEFA